MHRAHSHCHFDLCSPVPSPSVYLPKIGQQRTPPQSHIIVIRFWQTVFFSSRLFSNPCLRETSVGGGTGHVIVMCDPAGPIVPIVSLPYLPHCATHS